MVKLGPFLSDAWMHRAKMGTCIFLSRHLLRQAVLRQRELSREMQEAKTVSEEAEAEMQSVLGEIEKYGSLFVMRGIPRCFYEEGPCDHSDCGDGTAHSPKKARTSE